MPYVYVIVEIDVDSVELDYTIVGIFSEESKAHFQRAKLESDKITKKWDFQVWEFPLNVVGGEFRLSK